MQEGLFDRYFRLLAGRLPATEYGVIADSAEEEPSTIMEASNRECLCRCA